MSKKKKRFFYVFFKLIYADGKIMFNFMNILSKIKVLLLLLIEMKDVR